MWGIVGDVGECRNRGRFPRNWNFPFRYGIYAIHSLLFTYFLFGLRFNATLEYLAIFIAVKQYKFLRNRL